MSKLWGSLQSPLLFLFENECERNNRKKFQIVTEKSKNQNAKIERLFYNKEGRKRREVHGGNYQVIEAGG